MDYNYVIYQSKRYYCQFLSCFNVDGYFLLIFRGEIFDNVFFIKQCRNGFRI